MTNRKLKGTISNWEHFKEEHPNIAQRISKLKKPDQLSRDIVSTKYDFWINDDRIQIIDHDGYITYTFVVHRDNEQDGLLENYVYKEYVNGDYKQYLITYKFTIDSEGTKVFDSNYLDVQRIEDDSLLLNRDCVPHYTSEWVEYCEILTNCTLAGHEPGDYCECETIIQWCKRAGSESCEDREVFTFVDCSTGASSDPESTNPNNPDNPDTGGGPGNNNVDNNNPNNTTQTMHLDETAMDRIIECSNLQTIGEDNVSFPQSLLDSLQANKLCAEPLGSFIQNKGCTNTNKTFAIEAARACLQNDEVDFENGIILDSTFVNSKIKCVHDKFKTGHNLYSRMLQNFNNNNSNFLIFDTSSNIQSDWGIAKGSNEYQKKFTITLNENLNEKSNLLKMVTLSHELIHVYMMDILEDWNFITYDNEGNPLLNINCPSGINYNSLNLNSLSVKSRFVALICAMNVNGNLDVNWFHEMFNIWNFDIGIYRENLESFILNNHDWDNESTVFKNEAQNVFGNDWRQKIAEGVSWIGLELTDDYPNYLSQYQTNVAQFSFINNIRQKIENLNSICP